MEFITEINKNNLLYSVIANILAAIVVAFIFFLLKDVFFKFPEFNGRYYLKLIVEETDYNPYREMEMHFLIYFSSSNGELVGGGERIYEDSSRGMKVEHVIHYSGSSKIPIDVSGRIIKRMFLSIFRRDVNGVILKFLKEDLAGVFLIKLELHI